MEPGRQGVSSTEPFKRRASASRRINCAPSRSTETETRAARALLRGRLGHASSTDHEVNERQLVERAVAACQHGRPVGMAFPSGACPAARRMPDSRGSRLKTSPASEKKSSASSGRLIRLPRWNCRCSAAARTFLCAIARAGGREQSPGHWPWTSGWNVTATTMCWWCSTASRQRGWTGVTAILQRASRNG